MARGADDSGKHRHARAPGAIDEALLRRAFGRFPTGVAAVCGLEDGSPLGLVASSFTSVSLEPPLVLICAAHSSRTWPRLGRLPALGLSILGEGDEVVVRRLTAPARDRFADLAWYASPDGAVLLEGAAAWFECRIEEQVRGGDHDVVLLSIDDVKVFADVAPLVFHASQFTKLAE